MTAATAALSPEPHPGSGPGATADDTDFCDWERQLTTAGNCTHPIRLRGRIDAIDLTTGELAPVYDTSGEDGGVLHVACGNRREAVCPACSQVYKRDARQLVRAGLAGGKGIPETITAHPCVFATLTAPSFGPVHSRRMRGKTVLPCRPRRDAKARRCPHGRDISCPTRHVEDDPRLGRPMCPDCYDYTAAVLFNAYAGDLWRRFTTYLPRHLARLAGITQKHLRERAHPVRQGRRISGTRRRPLPRRDPPRRPRRRLPAAAGGITAALLCDAIGQAAAAVRLAVPTSTAALTFGAPQGPTPGPSAVTPGGHRQAAGRPGRRELHRQVRDQDPDRPWRPIPAAAVPDGDPVAALLGPLQADDHYRVAARRQTSGRRTAASAVGAHAWLRRALPDQIPPLLGHLRPAPQSPHRAPSPAEPPGRRTRPLGPSPR